MKHQETLGEAVDATAEDKTTVVLSDDEFEITVREVSKSPKARGVLAE